MTNRNERDAQHLDATGRTPRCPVPGCKRLRTSKLPTCLRCWNRVSPAFRERWEREAEILVYGSVTGGLARAKHEQIVDALTRELVAELQQLATGGMV